MFFPRSSSDGGLHTPRRGENSASLAKSRTRSIKPSFNGRGSRAFWAQGPFGTDRWFHESVELSWKRVLCDRHHNQRLLKSTRAWTHAKTENVRASQQKKPVTKMFEFDFAWKKDIVDETHTTQSFGGKDVQIFQNLKIHVRKWFVTGTPFESSPDQMRNWISFPFLVFPLYFGGLPLRCSWTRSMSTSMKIIKKLPGMQSYIPRRATISQFQTNIGFVCFFLCSAWTKL